MPGKPTRTALEPLAPALAGIGLALLLLGMLAWTLLPMLAPDDEVRGTGMPETELVWRKPGDFREVSQEQPKPETPAKPAAEVKKAPPPPAPAKPAAEVKKAPPPPAPVTVAPPKQGTSPELNKLVAEPLPTSPRAAASGAAVEGGLENSISSASGMDAFLPRRTAGGLSAQIGGGLPGKGKVAGQAEPARPLADTAGPSETVQPLREPAKYIAISAITKTAPQPMVSVPQPVPSLLQIAVHNEADRILAAETGGADMGPVEKALQRAMLEAWKPPSPTLVPADQRRVEVRLAVLRDGALRDAVVHKKSGSQVLDESVDKMLQKVVKISESLPVKFPGTRYSLQVNLQID